MKPSTATAAPWRSGGGATAGMVRAGRWLLAPAVLLVVGLVAPSGVLPALSITLAFVPAALGLALLLGHAGQLSLGQGALVGVGAYSTAVLVARFGVDHLLAVVLAAVITVAVAAVASPVLRLQGLTFALATLALGFVLVTLYGNANEWTGGPSGFSNTGYRIPYFTVFGFSFASQLQRYLILVGVALLAYVLCRNVLRGRSGVAYAAIATDEEAAQAMGIPTYRVKAGLWLLSASLCSLSGSMFVFYSRFAAPDQFDLSLSALLVASVIAGGQASLLGPVAALVLISVPAEVVPALDQYAVLLFGVIIILVLSFVPDGLHGAVRRLQSLIAARGREGSPEPVVAPATPADADLTAGADEPGTEDALEPTLVARDVSVEFGGLRAVDGAHLDVRPSEILGLIGPNGAGKTTMVNAMTGLVRPSQGQVVFRGEPITSLPAHVRAGRGLRRTFQNVRLVDRLDVLQNIRLGAYTAGQAGMLSSILALPRYRRDRRTLDGLAMAALEEVGLQKYRAVPAASLPAGVRRRLEVARAIPTQPAVVILDEPAAGLNDVETSQLEAVVRDIAASGAAVVIIEHDLQLVMRLCHRIVVMHKGQVLAEGTPIEVRENPEVREAYLGPDFTLDDSGDDDVSTARQAHPAGDVTQSTAQQGGPGA